MSLPKIGAGPNLVGKSLENRDSRSRGPPRVRPRDQGGTMPEDPTDDSIGAKLLRGDEETWSVVLAEILPRARAAIRRRFGPDRRSLGAEDVVDSALRTIFRRLKVDTLVNGLNGWDDLQGLL